MAKKTIVITGGAGFIGANACYHFLKKGYRVAAIDNLSRRGTAENLKWLKSQRGDFSFHRCDVRHSDALVSVLKKFRNAAGIIHLAGQVAVTTSVTNPREDFSINAAGTFNLLEAVRKLKMDPLILYSSTNKVYGGMEDIKIVRKGTGYAYRDYPKGIHESFGLDFHSPYGCSKGSADQYMHDYNRIYGIPTVVLRQSCIYGYRQLGVEDQGWVAWFLIAVVLKKPITIYGDGRQVRDILFIDDLIRLYELCLDKRNVSAGKIYNVGGGPRFTLSVWAEFGPMLEKLTGRKIPVRRAGWRPGDQKVFVSNIDKAKRQLGWVPEVSPKEGIRRLYQWVMENRAMLSRLF